MKKTTVVKVKGGKLHINNDVKENEFRFIWEEEDMFWASDDGESWTSVITTEGINI